MNEMSGTNYSGARNTYVIVTTHSHLTSVVKTRLNVISSGVEEVGLGSNLGNDVRGGAEEMALVCSVERVGWSVLGILFLLGAEGCCRGHGG